jgi:hypothetical protein
MFDGYGTRSLILKDGWTGDRKLVFNKDAILFNATVGALCRTDVYDLAVVNYYKNSTFFPSNSFNNYTPPATGLTYNDWKVSDSGTQIYFPLFDPINRYLDKDNKEADVLTFSFDELRLNGCNMSLPYPPESSKLLFAAGGEPAPLLTNKSFVQTQGKVSLKPNPTSDVTNVGFEAKTSGVITLEIVSSNGVVVYSKKTQVEQGEQQVELITKALVNGVYIIRGSGAGTSFVTKMIKMNK